MDNQLFPMPLFIILNVRFLNGLLLVEVESQESPSTPRPSPRAGFEPQSSQSPPLE
jgi:hypothetical protein